MDDVAIESLRARQSGHSAKERCYLPARTRLEMLSSRWHTWSHLVAPVPRALNLLQRHVPLMESFIANPSVHVAASSNPALLGGAFLELAANERDYVKDLLAETRRRCANLLTLAQSVQKLQSTLVAQGKGFSLDAFYRDLTPELTGLVELTYDLNNNASFRVREELLYGQRDLCETFREVSLAPESEPRHFFINTPRSDRRRNTVVFESGFADERLALLGRMRRHGVDGRLVSDAFGDALARCGLLSGEPPESRAPDYGGEGVRVRYFGHACVLLQTSKTSILVDPRFAAERDDTLATLTFDDLPELIDYVFISHAHQDHFDMETLVQLRDRIGRIIVPANNRGSLADPSMALVLRELGFERIDVAQDLKPIPCEDGQILPLPFPGEHCDVDIQSKHCAAITLRDRTFLFLVDSDAVDKTLYTRLTRHMPPADVLFIGMECHGAPLTWLYGPLLAGSVLRRDDDSRRGSGSNCERALAVVEELGVREINVYAMGMEPWNRHLLGLEYAPDSIQMVESQRFIDTCRSRGLRAERLKGCRETVYR